jgi:hypothetical protein
MPLLDLTEREDSAPVPAGKYRVSVADAEERETGGNGKLPEGTPLIWTRLKIEEALFEPFDDEGKPVDPVGRSVFNQTVIPPAEIDGEPYKNYKMMNGILFRTLLGFGYTKEELESGDFELDVEDLKGREAIATVGRREYKDPDTDEVIISNTVKGIKPAGEQSGVL